MRAKFMFIAIISWSLVTCVTFAQEHIGGIGALVESKNHALIIIQVLPNTPAFKAGLIPGLIIQKIDGTATADKHLKDCVDMLRGAAGTTVKLELIDTAQSQTNTVELT